VAQAQEFKPEALPLKAQGDVLAGEPAIESVNVVDLLKCNGGAILKSDITERSLTRIPAIDQGFQPIALSSRLST